MQNPDGTRSIVGVDLGSGSTADPILDVEIITHDPDGPIILPPDDSPIVDYPTGRWLFLVAMAMRKQGVTRSEVASQEALRHVGIHPNRPSPMIEAWRNLERFAHAMDKLGLIKADVGINGIAIRKIGGSDD